MRSVLALFLLLPSLALADVAGPARVIDGDTLEIAGQRIRLHGIDAPESDQQCQNKRGTLYACGEIATRTLSLLIGSQAVRCEGRDHDRYGRTVAVCYVGRHDIGRQMVLEGWALAYRRYSTDYVDSERAAQAIPEGMWKGRFIEPWEWRQGKRFSSQAANDNRAPSTPNAAPSATCNIKGNISSKGERIYHVPGGRYYEATQIDTAKGERWFCSEAEAQAVGWRRSRR